MTFTFANTPFDGIPFDQGSSQEIAAHNLAPRALFCEMCDGTVFVNIEDIVHIDELSPVQWHGSLSQDQETWRHLWNKALFTSDVGLFRVVCPHCGMIEVISKIQGEE